MATYDFWSARARLVALDSGHACRVCGGTFDRWRAAADHDCPDQRRWRRYSRAFWRSVRNNRSRRQRWYKHRMTKRAG